MNHFFKISLITCSLVLSNNIMPYVQFKQLENGVHVIVERNPYAEAEIRYKQYRDENKTPQEILSEVDTLEKGYKEALPSLKIFPTYNPWVDTTIIRSLRYLAQKDLPDTANNRLSKLLDLSFRDLDKNFLTRKTAIEAKQAETERKALSRYKDKEIGK
ncbi:MAG TPA: hypothetical protein VGT41_01450 [Candidatus Babeliales bacterium]|nr:hypothetical protein [Candidatus Babeliales bacterium]